MNIIITKKTVLITGGAGYIGCSTVLYMIQMGYKVIVVDLKMVENFFFKKEQALGNLVIILSDYGCRKMLRSIFRKHSIDIVIHLASFIEVSVSIKKPANFYDNNVAKTLILLEVMRANKVNKIIFASSSSVYGILHKDTLTEDHDKNPISPYGKTKLIIEMILQDYVNAYNFQVICLRYFNAAGAMPDYFIGEQHNPETHIIPLILYAVEKNAPFSIFGTDYLTKDGTCIRDYIHICDIANAHFLCSLYLEANMGFHVFNLGSGIGFSVKEIVHVAQQITKKKINLIFKEKRLGDSPVLIANTDKINKILGWKPAYSTLDYIISTAYEFSNLQ